MDRYAGMVSEEVDLSSIICYRNATLELPVDDGMLLSCARAHTTLSSQ